MMANADGLRLDTYRDIIPAWRRHSSRRGRSRLSSRTSRARPGCSTISGRRATAALSASTSEPCVTRFAGTEATRSTHAGDGFFYAFSTAADAARAVGEALAALEGGPVRIRAGIHTGEPIVEAPKYVGLDVHRAARIMAAAHGGQALSATRRATCSTRASPSAISATTGSRISLRRNGSSNWERAISRGRERSTSRTFRSGDGVPRPRAASSWTSSRSCGTVSVS